MRLYENISDACNNHFLYVNQKLKDFTPIWISPYGSMNYGTYNPQKSDTDTKMIILPSFAFCNENLSHVFHKKLLSFCPIYANINKPK